MTCCSPSGCGTPSTCCGCKEDPPTPDACMCGCAYLNGPVQIIMAQFLTFTGAWMSFAALGDCAFAELSLPTSIIPGIDFPARRIGFITFEGINGQCYWYDRFTDIVSSEDQLQAYWNVIGEGWTNIGIVGYVAAAFSWYFFWYTTSFCCSSQVRTCRYLSGFTMSIVLTVLQGCTFIAYRSEFCDEFGCSFGRSAGFSVGAILCYFLAGIAFFMTSDYPGERWQPPPGHDVEQQQQQQQQQFYANDYAQEIQPKDIAGGEEQPNLEAQTY